LYSLLRSEWKKVNRNIWVTGFLVWIFPVGIAAFHLLMILLSLIASEQAREVLSFSSGTWISDITSVWQVVSTFPGNVFGAVLPLAFVALIFSGEYQWRTWYLIIPRNTRSRLFFSKLLTAFGVIMLALFVTSLLLGAGRIILHVIAGIVYEPQVNADTFVRFVKIYGLQAVIAGLYVLILASYSALAAILTRSVLGGLLGGFLLGVTEPMMKGLLGILGYVLNVQDIERVAVILPTYNLENIRSWLINSHAFTYEYPGHITELSLMASTLLIAIWLGVLIGISLRIFKNQDIIL
jgi:hypothetical protein